MVGQRAAHARELKTPIAPENLRKTRRLAHDLVPPPAACNTWRALYLGLDALERELMEHIHLENNVLFPRVLAD